jgi:glycosyltransferase involved in cell wall biosynthesis
MRIGIDIRSLQTESQFRGIGTFTSNVVNHLVEVDRENEYFFFASAYKKIRGLREDLQSKVIWLKRPTRLTSLTDQFLWYPVLKAYRIDIFHAMEFAIPRFSPCKRVITIYDLIPLIFQEYKTLRKLPHHLVYLLKFHSTRWAEKVIAISESVKNDLIRILGLPEEKIEVILGGVREIFQPSLPADQVEALKKKYHLEGDYLIFPCGFEPRKNVLLTILAFQRALEVLPGNYQLALVGNLSQESQRIRRYISEKGLDKQVILTGYASPEDLSYLYNGAKLCLFPSLYEGFGLPALEAMACGLPVITSNDTSLPEVVGDAAVLVNPYSVTSITEAIIKVLTNPDLQKNLREKGLKRAASFSWHTIARQTLEIYRQLK